MAFALLIMSLGFAVESLEYVLCIWGSNIMLSSVNLIKY
jgi:hypothetical protein